jgi:hypothetical protein
MELKSEEERGGKLKSSFAKTGIDVSSLLIINVLCDDDFGKSMNTAYNLSSGCRNVLPISLGRFLMHKSRYIVAYNDVRTS